MADITFNISKGRVAEMVRRVDVADPADSAILFVLLAASGLESDSVLQDYDTLAAILAAANDEATNTGYSRKELIGSDLSSPAPDDTNNWMLATLPSQSWTLDGDGTGAVGALLICYDPDTNGGDDSTVLPLTKHDFSVSSPDGSVVSTNEVAGAFFRAS